jgi:flagellar basal body rod protein FlgC
MSTVSSIAVSGMLAASTRLEVAAGNIAKAGSSGATRGSDAPADLSTEIVNALQARYSFAANALVLKVEDRTTKDLLDIKV